jgi:hypothetical protein
MKAFVIETRRGFFQIPERIAGYNFPANYGQLSSATRFPFRLAAERSMRKHHLRDAPFHAHIEEIEID